MRELTIKNFLLWLAVFAISLFVMVQSVRAVEQVAPVGGTPAYMCWLSNDRVGNHSTPELVLAAWRASWHLNATGTIVWPVVNHVPGSYSDVYGGGCYSSNGTYQYQTRIYIPAAVSCPAPPSGSPYIFNPSTGFCERAEVPLCPAHASDTPCTCDAGYQFDAAGTSCVSSCPQVGALTAPPFNDACAEVLENIGSTQAQKDAACGALTPALQAGKACFEGKLAGMSPAIPMKITGDIRSVAYQAHLREIWKKMQVLVKLMKNDPAMQTACAVRRAEIAAEKGCDKAGPCTSCFAESATQRSHCLKGRPAKPSPNDAQHTQGNAFDVSEYYTITPLQDVLGARNPPQTIQQFLDAPINCNLNWGGMFTDNYDPIHFYAR